MSRLNYFFLERAITIDGDKETYKNYLKKAFIASTIYSMLYGWYEHFIVFNYVNLLDIIGLQINWAIMYMGVIILIAFISKFRIEHVIFGLFYMTLLEDVFSHSGNIITLGKSPFPAANWYDETMASFRVLGGLGRPIPFWPYVPLFYLPGFALMYAYYIISVIKGAKASRIYAWIVGPFYLAILAGTLWNDSWAIMMLIIIPSVSYLYVILIFNQNDWKFREKEN